MSVTVTRLKLDASHTVLPGTSPGYEFGPDSSTGFYGIKWDVTDEFSEGDFTIVLDGEYAGAHRTGSNCRIETNLELEPGGRRRPSMTAAFD